MSAYLQRVLQGEILLLDIKEWLTRNTGLPPGPHCHSPSSPCSPFASSSHPSLSPHEFRVNVLNYVKEEAEVVFAAAEQRAAAQQLAIASTQTIKPKPVPPPGAVSDTAFPTLSGQPHKVSSEGRISI